MTIQPPPNPSHAPTGTCRSLRPLSPENLARAYRILELFAVPPEEHDDYLESLAGLVQAVLDAHFAAAPRAVPPTADQISLKPTSHVQAPPADRTRLSHTVD